MGCPAVREAAAKGGLGQGQSDVEQEGEGEAGERRE